MRLGELCAGYGGLGMAVEEVFNADTAWFSEFDAAPSKILAHHWPNVPNYGDMTKIDWAAIEPVDIISGGTPCQDLSAAGRRAGMTEGTRSNLAVEFLRAVEIIRPKYVVWENVRGAYSAKADSDLEFCPGCMGDRADGGVVLRALGRLLGGLSDLGYDVQWRGLRAADVGACHGRFRVFILAANRDYIGHERGRETRRRRPGFENSSPTLPNSSRYGRGEGRAEPAGLVRGLHASRDSAPLTNSSRHRLHGHEEPNSKQETHEQASQRRGHLDGLRLAASRVEARRYDAALGIDWGDYEPAIRRWEARLGRPAPRPTEPTARNIGHRLSPRFTEWMMGLPDGWVTDPAIGISRNEQLKACGNGVVPQQAVAALQDMLAAFELPEVA